LYKYHFWVEDLRFYCGTELIGKNVTKFSILKAIGMNLDPKLVSVAFE